MGDNFTSGKSTLTSACMNELIVLKLACLCMYIMYYMLQIWHILRNHNGNLICYLHVRNGNNNYTAVFHENVVQEMMSTLTQNCIVVCIRNNAQLLFFSKCFSKKATHKLNMYIYQKMFLQCDCQRIRRQINAIWNSPRFVSGKESDIAEITKIICSLWS